MARRAGTRARKCLQGRFAACRRKPRGGKKRRDGLALAQPQFQNEDTRGRQKPVRIGRNRPVTIEAVGAAVERTPGIEVAHLGLQRRDVAAGHIGRIGHDEIEVSRERGAIVAGHERRAGCRGPAPAHCRARNRARRG